MNGILNFSRGSLRSRSFYFKTIFVQSARQTLDFGEPQRALVLSEDRRNAERRDGARHLPRRARRRNRDSSRPRATTLTEPSAIENSRMRPRRSEPARRGRRGLGCAPARCSWNAGWMQFALLQIPVATAAAVLPLL